MHICRHPRVMLQVGNPGDVGSVEMQDLIFTTKGPTPGAVLVRWNIKADKKGSAGLWGKLHYFLTTRLGS